MPLPNTDPRFATWGCGSAMPTGPWRGRRSLGRLSFPRPEGEVRLNLNGAGERRTFTGAFLADQFGAGVQHIAFQTDDIFERSGHLATAGFQRLKMSGNYYEDLAVAFQLEPETIERPRVGHILYGRSGEVEYFQIHGAPLFRGFFFEIVERKGGDQGYGARNAPIRLAAEMRDTRERQKT